MSGKRITNSAVATPDPTYSASVARLVNQSRGSNTIFRVLTSQQLADLTAANEQVDLKRLTIVTTVSGDLIRQFWG